MSRATLLCLLLSLGLLWACGPTRGGSRDDDDDDSAAEDDDSTSGDDDDTTSGDDDDSTTSGPASLAVGVSSTDFGDTSIGAPVTRTVSLSNAGGAPLTWSAWLTWDLGGVFALGGGDVIGIELGPGDAITRTVTYTPDEVEANFTSLVVTHNGSNASPVVVYFSGTGGGVATESACNDGLDNDADGYPDCSDWDCIGSSACGDPCCGTMPWPASPSMCDSGATLSCMCSVDPYCCEDGWNVICSDIYTGVDGACAPSPTCPQ